MGLGRWAWVALGLAGVLLATAVGTRAARDGEPAAAPTASASGEATPPGGTVDEAIAGLEKKLAADPKDVDGWKMLGWSYFQTGRHADAARAYERAVALKGDDAELWSALGEARTLLANGVDAPAHQAFARAVAIDPKDARARYFLGVEKDVAGDHRGAIDLWLAVLNDAPADAPYAQSVRELVTQVSTRHRIDVAGRMPPAPAPGAMPPAGMAGPLGGDGAAAASAAIPGPTQEQLAQASSLTPTQQDEMARGMVARLAARLEQNPKDADGWIRLMRARMVLGDQPGAVAALKQARTVFAGDRTTLGRFDDAAKALGVNAG